MSVYTACWVKDEQGKLHDIDLYTSSMDWKTRLRAVRRWCESRGIMPTLAYVGGNLWTRLDVMGA